VDWKSGVGGVLVRSKTPYRVFLVLSTRKACNYVLQKWTGRQDIFQLFVVEWMSECASNVVGLLPTSAAYQMQWQSRHRIAISKATFQDMLNLLNVTQPFKGVPNTQARLTVELFTPANELRWLENRFQDPPAARPYKALVAPRKRGKAVRGGRSGLAKNT
jgi:hypothetical protein